MKKCTYGKWIHRYIDKELDESEENEFKNHLSLCNNCRREISGLGDIKNLISSAREDLSLGELKYKVMERVDEFESFSLKLKLEAALLYRRLTPVLATVAILFAVLSIWDASLFHMKTDSAVEFLENGEIELPEWDLNIL